MTNTQNNAQLSLEPAVAEKRQDSIPDDKKAIQAVSVDNNEVMNAIDQLKQEHAEQEHAEQMRQIKLEQQAEAAHEKRIIEPTLF